MDTEEGMEERKTFKVSIVWEVNSAKNKSDVEGKVIQTWQPIENEVPDDVFLNMSTPTQNKEDPPLRFLDYKSDDLDTNNNDDAFFKSFKTSGDISLNSSLGNTSSSCDGRSSLENSSSNVCTGPDVPKLIYIGHSNGSMTDSDSVQYEEFSGNLSHSLNRETFVERPSDTVEVTRRQVVSVKPHIRSKSLPASSFEKRISTNEEVEEDQLLPVTAKLVEVTKAARMVTRPLLRSNAEEYGDEGVHEYKMYNFISVDSPPTSDKDSSNVSVASGEEEGKSKTDFDILNEITAMTRKATRPKVKDLEFTPSRQPPKRTRSVTQSPRVPALSPPGERPPLSARSQSSSGSSSSEFPFLYNEPDPCFRCGRTVYQFDKIGPIRKALFHKQCFKCCKCGSTLNVKNYFPNITDKADQNIYCRKHKPEQEKAQVTLDDKNISVCMNYPKLDRVVSNIVRGPEDERNRISNSYPYSFRDPSTAPKLDVVCKQWDAVNQSLKERVEHASPGGRRGDRLSLDLAEPRSMWSRSTMGAALLDLGTSTPRRSKHHIYTNGTRVGASNYM